MSFVDCIRTAQETGTISEKKAKEAIEAFNEGLIRAGDDGLSGVQANDFATMEAVKAIDTRNAAKRWQRINQMRRAHELHQRFSVSKDFAADGDRLMKDIETAKLREVGRAQSLFTMNLEKYRPRGAGLWHPVSNMDDIVRALYDNPVASKEAQELAREAKNVESYLVKRLNAFGASIVENTKRRMPQIHDRLKLRRAGEDKWVSDHLREGVLDWDVMEYDGKYIPMAQREKILRTVYQTITTDGYNKRVPGQGRGQGSLATELSRERFLYYKSADSWLEMNQAYGRGNVFQQFIGQIESMATHVALLEKLGPNPDAGLAFVRHTVEKRAAELDNADTAKGGMKKRSYKSRADYANEAMLDQYNILSRRILNGEENMAATAPATIRTLIGVPALGSAAISAVGDLGFARHEALMNRLPGIAHLRSYIKYMLPGNRNAKKLAIRSGLIAESAASYASGYQRYFGPMLGNAVARRLSDVTFRATLLTPHTQASKWAWGMELMGMFADESKKSWDQLSWSHMAERYGITEKDWDVFRQTAIHDPDGAHLLRPNDLFENAKTSAERRVADKFQDMILESTNIAVPTADIKVLSTLGHSSNPGTWQGEFLRTVGMLKTFPMLTYTLYLREMMQRATPMGRLAYFGSFAATTVLTGALITQLKALAAGKDPEDMSNPAFWVKATINGGTLGLFGDVAVNGTSSLLGGPVPQFLDAGINAAKETGAMIAGDRNANPTGDLIKMGSKLVPGTTWWPTKLILQRAMWDQIIREADPQAYRRMKQYERQQARDNGNKAYWPIGGSPRQPDIGSAFGQ